MLPRSRRIREWPIQQLGSVGVLDRDFTPYTGGMHSRMEITLKNGEKLLFVVKDLSTAIEELRRIAATDIA